MKLGEYLDEKGLRYGVFAKKNNLRYMDVYKTIYYGNPPLDVALAIEKATKNAVKVEELVEAERVPRQREQKEKDQNDSSFEEIHSEHKQFEKSPK